MFRGIGITEPIDQNALAVAEARAGAVQVRISQIQNFWENISAKLAALPESDHKLLMLQRIAERRARLADILNRLLLVKQHIVEMRTAQQVQGLGQIDPEAEIAELQAELDQQALYISQLQAELATVGIDTHTIVLTQPVSDTPTLGSLLVIGAVLFGAMMLFKSVGKK